MDVKSGKTTKLTVRRKYRSYYFHVLLERGSPEVRKPKQKITVRFEENIGVRDAGFIDVDGYLKVYISDKEYRQWKLGNGWFAALILNRRNLAGPSFVHSSDMFALQVNAKEVRCDWGMITVPLWGLSIEKARQRCEDYLQKYWLNEKRFITITY